MRDGIDEDLLDSSSPSLGAGSDGESGERCGRTYVCMPEVVYLEGSMWFSYGGSDHGVGCA